MYKRQLRDKEKELLAQKEAKETEIKASGVDLFDEVDEESIAEAVSYTHLTLPTIYSV